MIRTYFLAAAAAAAAAALSSAAGAQVYPAKELCARAQNGVISPQALRYQALRNVPLVLIDQNDDGSLDRLEMFAALTGSINDEANALMASRNNLRGFWKRHDGVDIQQTRKPTSAELAVEPALRDEPEIAQLLDEQRRFVTLRCLSAASTIASGVGEPVGKRLDLGTFLLARDLEGLTAPRGKPGQPGRLKKVPPAEISFVDNRVANTESFNVTAAAGVKVLDTSALAVMPFVQFVRSHVENKATGTTQEEAAKLNFGVIGVAYVTELDVVEFAPLYTIDLEDESEVLSGRVSWRPGFLYGLPSFRSSRLFGCAQTPREGRCRYDDRLFAVWTDVQIIAQFGKVLDPGTNAMLADGQGFLRAGPSATVSLFGLEGLVRDLSLDASYRHFFRISGPRKKVRVLRTGLNYWVGGSEHVSIRVGYEWGRDEDTLKRFEAWKLGFGARF